ncbi:MAG: hypothetical protein JWP69_2146 [Flaviaesturariibacter sp.]|nr:hypothetical protein [Flaviaesturariibacter sp.]
MIRAARTQGQIGFFFRCTNNSAIAKGLLLRYCVEVNCKFHATALA